MNKLIIGISLTSVVLLSSCKLTSYQGNYGQLNQSQVVLSGANFKVLGSFKGVASAKKSKISIKNEEGIVALAKANLLENAKSQGVILTGSRTLINVTVDLIQNPKMVTATVSAEIIEFTK